MGVIPGAPFFAITRHVPAPALIVAAPLLGGAAAAIVFVDVLDGRFAFLAAVAALLTAIAAAACALQDDLKEASLAAALGSMLAGLSYTLSLHDALPI